MPRHLLPAVLALVLVLLVPAALRAQGVATLVADTVTVTEERRLTASGNVEVFHDGTRLSAAAITYDEATDSLSITGPIYVQSPDGDILTAERASLDPALENGILRGARLVLDRRLQLAANRIDRAEGRYTQLYRSAATSCRVCGDRPPLWEIRAERVIHDEVAERLYFENAQLRLGGVPVAWVPRMRLPDPGVERATGLLAPNLRQTDQLGLGIKIPYFIALAPDRDLTLTPYLSPATTTLEARYRRAFLNGDLQVEAALTRDDIRRNVTRSYVFAEADWILPGGWQFAGQYRSVSDPAYLFDYDIAETDRLDSYAVFSRFTEDSRLTFGISRVQSLRSGDDNDQLPSILPSASAERVVSLPGVPGLVTLRSQAEMSIRTATETRVGRDVARLGLGADWTGRQVIGPGLLAELSAGFETDLYRIEEDDRFDAEVARWIPYVRAELRWPLARAMPGGTVHLVEPIVALGWSDVDGADVPNEDSQVVELDEVNLFALSRFPGQDAHEIGWQASAALRWSMTLPGGRSTDLTFGRLMRETTDPRFSPGTGLDGATSDWLLTVGADLGTGFSLDARALIDDTSDVTRAEARLTWTNPRLDLAATFVQLSENPSEQRAEGVAEWTFDAAYRLNDTWTISGDARYDVGRGEPQKGGLGLEYRNECVTLGLSVSRRFTSSTTLEPETDYGLRVSFDGFSAGDGLAPTGRTCRN